MEKSPLDIALERIEECKRTRAAGLDLAGLGLDHLPAEIAELTWLTALDCPFNQITDLTPLRALLLEGQLRELYVDKNPIQGIPAAITGELDCAEALRAYWQDLAKGAADKRAIKLILVGNGRVGKSTLAYALQHKHAPSEAFSVTHGIVKAKHISQLDHTQTSVQRKLQVFISYSQADDAHRDELEKRLKILAHHYPLNYWSDHQLNPSGKVHTEILRQLQKADVVLLLVSPDFMATDYCYDIEVVEALKSYVAQQNTVIPVIVRDTPDWQSEPFGQLTAVPHKGKPLEDYPSADKYWADVQQALQQTIKNQCQQRGILS